MPARFWSASTGNTRGSTRPAGTSKSPFQHDSIAVAFVISPELFQVERGKVQVLTDGVARGQTVFSPEGHHTFSEPGWAGLPTHSVCTRPRRARLPESLRADLDQRRLTGHWLSVFS